MVRSAECTIFFFMNLGELKSPTNILLLVSGKYR